MYSFPIGAFMDCATYPVDESIRIALATKTAGFQLGAAHGEYAPENMTSAKIAELNDKMRSNGLVFSALCGDIGRGFGHAELNPGLIEKSKRILDLAKELGTDIVTTHIGVVPDDPAVDRYKIMQEACYELSRYADSIGSHFAIETGPETSAVLKGFLDQLGSTGVAVNLDPANLVMVVGDDPVEAVHNLKDYIVHTHAKDGIMINRCNPEILYGVIPPPADFEDKEWFREVLLGQGSVDFPAYLKALEEIGYRGFLTIERSDIGSDPVKAIIECADYLRSVIAEN